MADKYANFLRSLFGEDETPKFNISVNRQDDTDFKLIKDPKTGILHSPAGEAYPSMDKSGQPTVSDNIGKVDTKDPFVETVHGMSDVIGESAKTDPEETKRLLKYLDEHEGDLEDVMWEFLGVGDELPTELFDKYPEAKDMADSIKQDITDQENGRPTQFRPRKFSPKKLAEKKFQPKKFEPTLISGPGRNLAKFLQN